MAKLEKTVELTKIEVGLPKLFDRKDEVASVKPSEYRSSGSYTGLTLLNEKKFSGPTGVKYWM